jgi:hypothetical protein
MSAMMFNFNALPVDIQQELERYKVTVSVTSADSYRDAVALRADARAYLAKVKLKFDPILEAAVATVARTRDLIREAEDPAKKLIEDIDESLATYEALAEEKRKREEIKLAVQQEREAEQQRQVDVEHLKRTGYISEAKKLEAEPLPAPVVPALAAAIPKVAGFQKRTGYEAKVTNLTEFRSAYRAGLLQEEAVIPNQPFLNAIARASKGLMNIPGVEVIKKTSRAQRKK